MCYHASVSATYQQVEASYAKTFVEGSLPLFSNKSDVIAYHHNGFDFPKMPVITSDLNDKLQLFNWGLIPSWVKDFEAAKQLRAQTLNARSESIFEKASFKNPILSSRCLIPMTGFFEWKEETDKSKVPYLIQIKNQPIFSMAGICSKWWSEAEAKEYQTFSIITTAANTLMEEIHNVKKRMPLILVKEQEELWLNKNLSQIEIEAFLKPFPSEQMEAFTISPIISSRSKFKNSPEVLKPYSYEKRDLFS